MTLEVAPGAQVGGPLVVLGALALSLASTAKWRRNVGETSCGWRVDYSPDGRAFAIWWVVIYPGTIVSAVAQLTRLVPVLDWWTNFLWAAAWVFCALWVPLFDAESASALRAAMLQILFGATAATAAVWHEGPWVGAPERTARVLLCLPLTTLAGWLIAASAINVGIAWKASRPGATATCARVPPQGARESEQSYRRRRRVLYREAYAKAPARVSFVPVVLALGVAGLATGARDPVLPVPLLWAVLNLKAFPSCEYVMAVVICACGTGGAVVRLFF